VSSIDVYIPAEAALLSVAVAAATAAEVLMKPRREAPFELVMHISAMKQVGRSNENAEAVSLEESRIVGIRHRRIPAGRPLLPGIPLKESR
jgi:hypothetical protein